MDLLGIARVDVTFPTALLRCREISDCFNIVHCDLRVVCLGDSSINFDSHICYHLLILLHLIVRDSRIFSLGFLLP